RCRCTCARWRAWIVRRWRVRSCVRSPSDCPTGGNDGGSLPNGEEAPECRARPQRALRSSAWHVSHRNIAFLLLTVVATALVWCCLLPPPSTGVSPEDGTAVQAGTTQGAAASGESAMRAIASP